MADSDNSSTQSELLEAAVRAGDMDALASLFQNYEPRLRKMLELRMHRLIRRRVSASDVLQQSYIDLANQLPNFHPEAEVPVYVWVRRITCQRLAKLHREHLGAQKRDAGMEVFSSRHSPAASSFALASQLVGDFTAPEDRAIRAEQQLRMEEVLQNLDEEDREIIALRSFEQLSSTEIAGVMGISTAAVRMRHLRALRRFQRNLKGFEATCRKKPE